MILTLFLALMALLPTGMPVLAVMGLTAFIHGRWRVELPGDLLLLPPMIALLAMLGLGATAKGAAQLIMCLSTMILFIQLSRNGLLDIPVRQFAGVTSAFLLLAAPLTIVLTSIPQWLSLMLVPGDHGGIRFRFIFPEPNPLAFIYFYVLLRFSNKIWQTTSPFKWLCVGGSLTALVAIGSPFALLGMLFVTAVLIVHLSAKDRMLVIVPMLAISTLLVLSPPASIERRIDLLASGDDNSLNLRTWGALAIAEATLEESGRLIQGAGIGRSREVLDENPLMSLFAAQEESSLPSMAATTLVETGYFGLACVGTLLVLGIFAARRSFSGTLAGILLVLHAASGGFFFDTLFWACLGTQLAFGTKASNPPKT